MKKNRAESVKTRQRIVNVAANEFRLNGITATGVASLMSKAGLTHGGFYVHFDSKGHLITEACAAAFEGQAKKFKTAASAIDGNGLRSIIDGYLSIAHSENRADGCPLAAMGSELARGNEHTRRAASRGLDDLVAIMASCIRKSQPDEARSRAVFAMAAMIGAVTMSRIIPDGAASAAVLQHVKQHLHELDGVKFG